MQKYILLVLINCFLVIELNAQSISNPRFSAPGTNFCAGATYTILFDTIGPIGNPNFEVQLSSSSGSFASPLILANSSSISMNFTFPNSVISSYNYAIRVVRNSPTLIISDTLKNIKISKAQANFSFSPNNACPGTNVSFTNSSTGTGKLNYNWVFNRTYVFGSPAARIDTNPVVTFNPFFGGATQTYGVRLIVTDSFGCIDSLNANVGVKQRPLALVSDSNIFAYPEFSNCQGNPSTSNPIYRLTVYNNCQVLAAMTNIVINWGDSLPLTLSPTFTKASHVYNSMGAFNLTVTANNNNGCTTTDTFSVSNQLAPTLSLNGPAVKQGCAPFNYPVIVSNYQNNSAGTYYTFDFDDGSPIVRINNLTSDTVWHTFNANSCSKPGGAFVIKAKAHNLCDSTPATLGNFRIWTKPIPQFSPNPDTTVCANTPVNITNGSTAGLYGLSCSNTTLYQWNFGSASPSISTQSIPPPVTFPSAGLFPVRLIATNPCGSDTINKQICAQIPPIANFSYNFNPLSRCKNNTLSFNNTSNTIGSCGRIRNKWSVLDSNGNTFADTTNLFLLTSGHPDSTNMSISFIKSGKYKIRLNVTNICGSSIKDTFIIIKDVPKISLLDSTVYCGMQNISFNGSSSAHQILYDSSFGVLSGFQWDITPNTFSFINGNVNSKSPLIYFPNNTTSVIHYLVIHYAINECGISLADSQVISILPSPTLIATANSNPVCSGAPVSISLSSNISNGVTYTWRASGNSNLSGFSNQFSNANGPINQTILNNSSNVDTVTYRILPLHAASNCYGDSFTFKLAVLPAVQNNSIQTNAAICEGLLAPIINGNSAAGGLGALSYRWQKWDGTNWINAGAEDSSQNYSPGILNQTTVFRRLVTTLNCMGVPASISNSDTVIVFPKPNVNAGNDLFKCKSDGLFNLGGNPSGGIWSGTGVITNSGFNPAVMPTGNYTLSYFYTDINSCSNSDTLVLSVRDNPIVYAGSDFSVCQNSDSIVLSGFNPAGGIWSGVSTSSIGRFGPSGAGVGLKNLFYQFTDTNNCSNTDTIQVQVLAKPTSGFNISSADSGCNPLAVNLVNSSLTNTTDAFSSLKFKWNFTGMTNDSLVNQSNTFYNSGIVDSVYSIQLISIAVNTCRDTIGKSVKVKPDAKAFFSYSSTVSCAPFVIPSNAFSADVYPDANSNYIWRVNQTQIGTGINFPGYLFTNANDSFKISLIALSLNGCKNDTFEKWFYTISNPRPDFIAIDSVACSGKIIQFQNNSFPLNGLNFLWEFGSNITTSNLANPSQTFFNYSNADTLVQVKLHAIAISGCRDSLTKNITIKPLPQPNFAFLDTVLCYPEKAVVINQSSNQPVLDMNGFIWKASSSNLTIENDTASTQTFVGISDLQSVNSNMYSVQLKAKTLFGCTDSFSQSFRQAGRPISGFSLAMDSACAPIQITTNNISLYGTQFNWTCSNSLVTFNDISVFNPTITFPVHRGIIDSIYQIKLITSSIDGCKDTTIKSFKAFPKPVTDFITSKDSGCADLLLSLKSTSIVKSPFELMWNFGDGFNLNSTIDTVQYTYKGAFLKDTLYHVQLITKSQQACYDTLFRLNTVKVKTIPKAAFELSLDTSCSPLRLLITNTSIGHPQFFDWNLDNGNSSALFEPAGQPLSYFAFDSISKYQIQLKVTNMCGVDSTSKEVLVLPDNLEASFGVSAKVGCESLRVQFGDNSKGSTIVSWDFGDGFTSAEKNPVHTYTSPGVYQAYQFVSNNCFYDTSMITITVLRKPLFDISFSKGINCPKQQVEFNSNLTDTGSIKWYFGDGDSSNQYDPMHQYLNGGKFPVRVRLQSFINACSTEILDTIEIKPLPKVDINVDTNAACFGHQFSFNASSEPGIFYTWSLGDGNTISDISIPNYLYINPGQYLVSLTGISIDGCKDSSTKYIQVWPKPIANFFHTPKDTCFGPANVVLTNLSIGANSYNWSFGNGNTAITKDAIQFYSGLGVYPIKLIVSNTFQCKDSFESTFEILNQPEASFDFNDSSGCLPYSVPFKNSSKGGSEYTWYFGDGDTSSEVSPTHIYTVPGIFSVSLVVKSGVVCRDSFTFYKPIRVDSKSGIKFTSQLIEDKKPYREVEFNTTTFNKFTFEWKFGDGNTGFGEQVFHKYAERDSGCFNVELKVVTTNNCDTFYTDTVCLPAYWEGLSVPNAFSPDYGTEQVRVFKPAGVELIKYEIKIFNKWGELVWQSNALVNGSPAEGWNGIDLNGNPCMQGNYIWMIEAEFTSGKTWQGEETGSKQYNRRGTLTLIR